MLVNVKKYLYTNLSSSNRKHFISNPFYTMACAGLALGLAACSSSVPHGSLVEKQDYDQLKAGNSTRADATEVMGTPTAKATFDENTWFYISQRTGLVPLSFPAVREQNVVMLQFDKAGVLQKMKVLDMDDAKDVTMVSDETPTPGTQTNFLQQLLGNIGEYSPLSNIGKTFGSGSSGLVGNGNGLHGAGTGSSGNTLP